MAIEFNTNGYFNKAALIHTVYSVEELKECIKAAKVFGLVPAQITPYGNFSNRTTKEITEDKETYDWYQTSEYNTGGKTESFDDESLISQSYWSLKTLSGKTLVFTVDKQEIKARFPLFPKEEKDQDSWYTKPQLSVEFTTPDNINS